MTWWTRRLPTIDACCAAGAGVLMLALHPWIAELYGLTPRFVLTLGAVNLSYASFGTAFTLSRGRPPWLLYTLIGANLLWTCVCVALAVSYWDQAGRLGRLHLLGEGAFVGGLGLLEWRCRSAILAPVDDAAPRPLAASTP
ncbi:MAG: hypothetical protein R3F62_16885 [Planctomycetota bacterium]